MDVDTDAAATLIPRLNMYKLRADVTISETDLIVSRGLNDAPEGAVADPRDANLGGVIMALRITIRSGRLGCIAR